LTIISETPEAPPDPVMRLVATAGSWEGVFDYHYFGTTSEGRYLYGMVLEGSTNRHNGDDVWDFEYDPSDGKFYDVGDNIPVKWGEDDTGATLLDFPTTANMETLYWYGDDGGLRFVSENPYYVA